MLFQIPFFYGHNHRQTGKQRLTLMPIQVCFLHKHYHRQTRVQRLTLMLKISRYLSSIDTTTDRQSNKDSP